MSAADFGESWCSAARIADAARRCAKRKGGRADAIAFRLREGEEVLALAERLRTGTYHPEPGRVFVTERPKYREVHAAAYRDRVVHHLIHCLVEPLFEQGFSEASFACRKHKGTHAAATALRERMIDLSRHGGVRVWALSMDVKNFFMSLHKPTLLELLDRRLRGLEERLRREGKLPPGGLGPRELCWRVVQNDPCRGARHLGPAASFGRVPPHKRLGALGPDRGIPIGNLTSQFFANVYLSPLDHFVQRTLGIRGYVRYVDDFVLLHPDRARLEACEARIVAFLRERLKLEVRAKPVIPVSRGVDFVGYIVRPRYVLARRRVVRALRDKLAVIERRLAPVGVREGIRLGLPRLGAVRGPVRAWRLDERAMEQLRATWASYDGHLVHANSFALRERLWADHPIASRFLARRRGGITRRFALTRAASSLRVQVARLAQGIRADGASRPAVLLVQVGRFVEVPHGPWRVGLHRRKVGRRWTAGAPWGAAARLIERALGRGYSVAVAIEEAEACGNVKRRRLAYLFERPSSPLSPLQEKPSHEASCLPSPRPRGLRFGTWDSGRG